jgi:hypothetical protein
LTFLPPIRNLGVQFVHGHAGAVLVVLAHVGVRTGQRANVGDLDRLLGVRAVPAKARPIAAVNGIMALLSFIKILCRLD